MRRLDRTALAASFALTTGLAQGQVSTLTQAGYTGLGITPNAHLIDWGKAEFTYDHQLPGVVRNPAGHNYVLGFGLLPNLEISGRLATNTLTCNLFTEGNCGIRDLSASGKVGIGLDAAHRFHAAAGITDVGGAATNFRSLYGVITYNAGPFQGSAGLARRSARLPRTSLSPLHGPFAAAAWTPLAWLRGQIEYTDGNAWAGVRLFAPPQWLPEGWNAYVGTNHRLTGTKMTRSAWITAGVSIPLYKVPPTSSGASRAALPTLSGGQRPSPEYEARNRPIQAGSAPPVPTAPHSPAAGAAPTQSTPAMPSAIPAKPVTDADLENLAAALEAKGLDDISVGRMPDGSIAVRANNDAYHWNSVDALGVALGVIARSLAETRAGYRLVLTQRQLPLVAVTGQSDCLRTWVNDPSVPCAAGQLSTPGTGALEPLQAGATWLVTHRNPSWRTVHVSISPVLRTNIGTEVGTFDYSLGANVGLRLPIWAGASVELRQNVPLANSSNYQATGVFGVRRIRSETERLVLTQTLRLRLDSGDDVKAMRWGLSAVAAQVSVGRVGDGFDGVDGAVRWEPGEGRHRLSAETAYLRNSHFDPNASVLGPKTAKPFLASYRYNVSRTRTYLEGTAGQFLYNDRGFQLGLRQWFSDVSVGAYYRRTHFSGAPKRQFVGIELTVPIGPRRDANVGSHLVLGGTPRFSHSVESLVRGGSNAVRPGFGLASPAASIEETFNSDRSGLIYFEDSIRRIRDAAR